MTEENGPLFDPADFPPNPNPRPDGTKLPPLNYPLWTEHKARLILRYLYYFVMITKHGTYIDGFAGSQNDLPGMWAAKLVVELQPRWLRNFHLIELDKKKIPALDELKRADVAIASRERRHVHVYQGDFNRVIDGILDSGAITAKEAAFCLLDQRTFECQWASVTKIAKYKPAGEHKIELFYFLPIGWLDRAFSGMTVNQGKIEEWWGRPDWRSLLKLSNRERRDIFVDRFTREFGYASVLAWPIYENQGSQRIMYYMVHASDHPEAPKLMRRAYTRAVDPVEPIEQLQLEWDAGTIQG